MIHRCRLCRQPGHHATTCPIEIGFVAARMTRDQRYRERQNQRLSNVVCIVCGQALTLEQRRKWAQKSPRLQPVCSREHATQRDYR